MKKIIIFIAIFVIGTNYLYSKTITLNIPDDKIKVMENDLLDVEAWINGAIDGKYNKCKERIIKSEIDLSIKNGEAIPAGEAAIINKYFARPEYKNRKQIEEESKIK